MTMVVLMVFIGGVTRLTESGLSIVEWKLVAGIFPPLSEEAWQAEFAEYQSSPEFQQKNFSFGVSEFKRIYWLEYLHRLLGRLTGLVFIAPLLYFTARKALPGPLLRRMGLACVLVAAQGAVGWIMVASGLVNDPRVNPLKLTLHLMLAFTLFALLLWTYWQATGRPRSEAARPMACWVRAALVVAIIQIALGALVAGNDAGLTYNTYPLMDGKLIPSGLWMLEPWHRNLFTHVVFVQFAHRLGAHLLVLVALVLLVKGWRGMVDQGQSALRLFAVAFAVQFLLGVATLVHAVPVSLGSAHQMGAIALLAALLNLVYLTKIQQDRP